VGSFAIASLATDGEFVYWIELDPHTPVKRVPVGGGPVTLLGWAGGGFPRALRVGSGRIFWIDRDATVASLPTTGGEMRIEVEGRGILSDLLVHGDRLYLAFTGSGDLGRIPLTGGPMEDFAAGEIDSIWTRLAADGGRIYRLGQGGLDRVDAVTGRSDILLEGDLGQDPFFSGAIAAANGRVWWTQTVSGKVRVLR
jgi:hypothetical protein